MKKQKWMNDNGQELSTNELKIVCKSWTTEDWESYLDYLEKPQQELILEEPSLIENFAPIKNVNESKMTNRKIATALSYLIEMIQAKLDNEITEIFYDAIACLSSLERKIVHGVYWENKKQIEVARDFSIKKSTVSTLHSRAIKKLRGFIVPEYSKIINHHAKMKFQTDSSSMRRTL